MLRALRKFSLKDHEFVAGDLIPPELAKSLPSGRVLVLKNQRFVEDEVDVDELIADLTKRVEALESRSAKRKAA